MKFFNLFAFGVKFLFQISLNQLTSIILFFLLILMELEFLLNDSLNKLIPKTLDKIELVLEDCQAEEDLLVLKLSFTELKLSNPAYFLKYRLDLALELLIKCHDFQCTIDWIWTVNFSSL